jgi:hypothetical protein
VILLYLEKTYGSLYYIGLGITVIVSVVEGGILNGGYIGEILAILLMVPMEQALPAAMIIGTLVDPWLHCLTPMEI